MDYASYTRKNTLAKLKGQQQESEKNDARVENEDRDTSPRRFSGKKRSFRYLFIFFLFNFFNKEYTMESEKEKEKFSIKCHRTRIYF